MLGSLVYFWQNATEREKRRDRAAERIGFELMVAFRRTIAPYWPTKCVFRLSAANGESKPRIGQTGQCRVLVRTNAYCAHFQSQPACKAVLGTQPRVRIQSSPPASLPFSFSRLRSARKGDFPAQNAAHAPDSIVFSFEHNSAKGAVEGWCVTRGEQRSVGRLRSGDRGTD